MEQNNIGSKKNTGLIVTLVVAIIVIIGLICYICYDKQLISIGNKKTESQINSQRGSDNKANQDNNDVVVDEDKSVKNEDSQNTAVTKLKSRVYATENDQYVLILNEYNRNWFNPKVGSTDNSFILSKDEYYTANIASGNYYMEGDKLTLFTLNNELNMLNELGVNVIADQGRYSVSLPITNNTVVIGNTILYLK